MFNLFKKLFKVTHNTNRPNNMIERGICPDCGTKDCKSFEWYRGHIEVVGSGVAQVPSSIMIQSCKTRKTFKKFAELEKKYNGKI